MTPDEIKAKLRGVVVQPSIVDRLRSAASNLMAPAQPEVSEAMQGRAEMRRRYPGRDGSPEVIAQQAELDQGAADRMLIETQPTGRPSLTKFVQGLPFVGQYSDELTGIAGNALGQGDRAMTEQRAVQDAMDREYPKTSMALQTAGGITGSAPLVIAGGPTATAWGGPTLLGRTIAAVTTGAAAGGTEGAVSGYGAGNDGDRTASALKGGALGAAFGAAFGGAVPIAGAGIKAFAEWSKGVDVTAIAKTLGISKDAAKVLKFDLEALDFNAARKNLRTAGADAMLADADIPMRQALDSAITGGGQAARIGINAISERAAASGAKLARVMDVVLGVPEGVKSAAKSIAQRTAPIRAKAYKMAYEQPIDYAGPKGAAVENVLSRIPTKTFNAAIDEANAAMKVDGIGQKQIMASIGTDGKVVFSEMPNVRQLDELKKALGQIGAEDVDQFGRATGSGARATRLARELKEAIADAVPGYGRAVKLGGDKLAEDRGLRLGRDLLNPSTTRETVRDTIADFGVDALDAVRKGLRGKIDDVLATVKRNVDDPDADTAETSRLLGMLSSRQSRENIRAVLGDKKAETLFTQIDAVGKQFGTRTSIAANSATARRTQRKATMDEVTAPGIIGSAAQGNLPKTFSAAVQVLTRETPGARSARDQKMLAEIANVLTTLRGTQAQQALDLIETAIQGQPLKTADAARIARLLSTSGALAGDQTVRQSLAVRRGAQ